MGGYCGYYMRSLIHSYTPSFTPAHPQTYTPAYTPACIIYYEFMVQVTSANIGLMRTLVINGPEKHPGANFIQQKNQDLKK